jgi:hypothetical protein
MCDQFVIGLVSQDMFVIITLPDVVKLLFAASAVGHRGFEGAAERAQGTRLNVPRRGVIWNCLLPGSAPPKLALEHIHREVDHRRPAVRTGARRDAGFQVSQQSALFFG